MRINPVHVALLSESSILTDLEEELLQLPAEVEDVLQQLASLPFPGWVDAAIRTDNESWHVALSPKSAALGRRLVLAVEHDVASSDEGMWLAPMGRGLGITTRSVLSRQECHDLKTLITAAMMGIEVARTGEAETGHSLATDALRQALDMLSPVEDPSVPTGLRQFE